MGRSPRSGEYVNQISAEKLKEALGTDVESLIRSGVYKCLADIGLLLVQAFMEAEVDELCGDKHSRKRAGQAVRWGTQPGVVHVNGAKHRLLKPRVRAKDGEGEIDLETYACFNQRNVLSQRTLALIGSGVSTREYAEAIGADLQAHGVSRSSVSRRVIAESKQALDAFQQRRWDKVKFVALLFDGVRIGKQMVVACVGVDCNGYKHVLGWNIGSTENEIVCRDLIRKLIDSGLNVDRDYLFVVDGAKALISAIKAAFGMNVSIQRCQEHKIRDVIDYLPCGSRRHWELRLRAAYGQNTYKQASKELQQIRLTMHNEQAVNSLIEGLEHTLTLHRLGINGGVRESLRTTNMIESTFSRLRKNTDQVKSWSDSDQVQRWLAIGLRRAEKGYRRLPGYRQLPKLQRKLKEHAALQSLNS